MNKKRYLTKSRFKLAKECPTKLFYTGKDLYPDENAGDSFLESLAKGGFQVGALAKFYFQNGEYYDLSAETSHNKSVEQTEELMKKKDVTIFEAAVRFQNLFIRVDVLVKKGNKVELIEVKAKSAKGDDEAEFLNAKGDKVNSDLRPYLEDVAFQKYVLSQSHPELKVSAFLMLADKSSTVSVDGLNQVFKIKKEAGRNKVEVDTVRLKSIGLGKKILVNKCADEVIALLYKEKDDSGRDFFEQIKYFADNYEADKKIITPVGIQCKGCEFQVNKESVEAKSGYKECWKSQLKWSDKKFDEPQVFQIWDYKSAKKRIAEGRYFMKELTEDDFTIKSTEEGLSHGERQWMQVEKSNNNDTTPYLDIDGLKIEMKKWKFPLHFIDFETAAVAVPFFKGMRPYEGVSFQFSHHTVSANGNIEHAGQYLNAAIGEFPNFAFIRNLKSELDKDNGSIFRYAPHENTYLNMIGSQLKLSKEKDKDVLMEWIKTITQSPDKSAIKWKGERNMIDLCKMVKKYFYHPLTKGSNSIKKVLPAVLNESKYLQAKYSKPVYGAVGGIKSLNFKNKVWIEFDSDKKTVKDPYKLLPSIFSSTELSDEVNNFIAQNDMDELSDGGAAMMAYNMLQMTKGFLTVTDALGAALYKYCELDTLAMVMIWEYWNHEINNAKN